MEDIICTKESKTHEYRLRRSKYTITGLVFLEERRLDSDDEWLNIASFNTVVFGVTSLDDAFTAMNKLINQDNTPPDETKFSLEFTATQWFKIKYHMECGLKAREKDGEDVEKEEWQLFSELEEAIKDNSATD